MLFAFTAIFFKQVFPIALLNPAWQLQAGEVLRSTASVPLVAVVLFLFARFFDPVSPLLASRVIWIRRLCIAAAIGFFLLIPLQLTASLSRISQSNVSEIRELRAAKDALTLVERAKTQREMALAIGKIPGVPPDFTASFNLPLPAVRAALLGQIRPQIRLLENRLRDLRSQRLQRALLFAFFDGLIAIAYGIGFAALGRVSDEQPTLLQYLIWVPSDLRRSFNRFRLSVPRWPHLLPRFRFPSLSFPRLPRLPHFPRRRSTRRGGFSLPFLPRRRSRRRRRSAQRRWFRFLPFRLPGSARMPSRQERNADAWLSDESDLANGPRKDSDPPA